MASSSRSPQGGRRSTMSVDSEDPLAVMTAPPEGEDNILAYTLTANSAAGETPEEAVERIKREKVASKISDDIDKELLKEAQAAKKRDCIKILLLGQSESGTVACYVQVGCSSNLLIRHSGKSTVLKSVFIFELTSLA
ncbi:hypothetical protein M422DRAFT_55024 [Sphaerobolus stellatus SS14]|uniref:Uncharacterized protein n=1 Tax=Sphaerobolus stellatus (strain SS14) TaxID=990650 RepID=A0A0C9UEV6_SPHS4|nr:hypothetical protein M422DRAFT_55024 [Sphaerobolus stellatus SS14]